LFTESGDDLLQGGMGFTVLITLQPEFIDRFGNLHIHRIIAGNTAGAAYLAVVDHIE